MADLAAFLVPLGTDVATWSTAQFKLGCFGKQSPVFDKSTFGGVGSDVVMGTAITVRLLMALMTLLIPGGIKSKGAAVPVIMSVSAGILINIAGIMCVLRKGDYKKPEKDDKEVVDPKETVKAISDKRAADTYLKLYIGNLLIHVIAMYILMSNFQSYGFALSGVGAMQGTMMMALIGLSITNFTLLNSRVKFNSPRDNKTINSVAAMMILILIVLMIHSAQQK